MKLVGKVLVKLLLILVILAVSGVGWLTFAEYRPAETEQLTARTSSDALKTIRTGEPLRLVSWNIGYAGLGKESDFFMDGGTHTASADADTVTRYLAGIDAFLAEEDADFTLLQEVDIDSSRTYGVDEASILARGESYHALNYSCAFVPYPWPPIGRVHCGLFTDTAFHAASAERIALPCPFTWPVRVVNLKRCLLAERYPVEGTDRELVLIDLHLEAYDDGEGKLAQTRQLSAFMENEYRKGNYVIAGGDFNQVFPGSLEVYPNTHPENWLPGVLEEDALPEGFIYACDLTVPTCRLLNQPYDPADTANTQYYVIDGFILSPNVSLESVESVDLGFENADHNPVRLAVTLE